MKTTKEQIVKILEKLPVYEPVSDSDIEVAATDIINLFDDPERKQIIWDEKNIKYPFKAAVNAVKSGSHQIEKDCDNLDLLRDVLKEAFPDQYIFDSKLFALKYFRMHLNVTNTFDNHTGTKHNNSDENLPIIKLSQIQPKEVNRIDLSEMTDKINSIVEKLKKEGVKRSERTLKIKPIEGTFRYVGNPIEEKPELNIYQELDKSIEILKSCKSQIRKEAIDKMVAEIEQSVKEAQEKPVELEVGKWYKCGKDTDKFLFFIETYEVPQPNSINQNTVKSYGFGGNGEWYDSDERSFGMFKEGRLATTEEITEALKNEAIKRGLVEGAWAEVGRLKKVVKLPSEPYKYDDEYFLMIGDKVLMYNGIWATPIPAITKAEAEEKLNAKIVD